MPLAATPSRSRARTHVLAAHARVQSRRALATLGLAATCALVLGTGTGVVAPTPAIAQIDTCADLLNVVTTAVPFLLLSPDSRSGAMGEAGVAISADANAIHWNPSKLVFATKKTGFSISYTPWLRNLGVKDIGLAYLSFYRQIDRNQAFGASLRYFSLGNIVFTDATGNTIGEYKPNEFAIDGVYSRRLSDVFSIGIAGRFIRSNLTLGQFVGAQSTKPGVSAAGDISGFYRRPTAKRGNGLRNELTAGFNISNLCAKINYTNSTLNNFLPTNLRIGAAYLFRLDQFNEITVTMDANKMLVPTPPFTALDTATGERKIVSGKDPNVPPLSGVFQSFADAPCGFREEMQEVNLSPGVEYWYDQQFAVRMGYHHEAVRKGGRQFLTFGAGLKYNVFGLDFAYLVPTRAAGQSPLANTLRFSLRFDFEAFRSPDEDGDIQRPADNATPPAGDEGGE